MRKSIIVSAIAFLPAGCAFGELKIEPSEYEFTEPMRKYVDGLEVRDESLDINPIPYVSKGMTTHRYAASGSWFLNYVGGEWVARLEDGYAYQDADFFFPLFAGVSTHLFDASGKRIGSRSGGLFGAYNFFPFLDLVSIHSEISTDHVREESSFACGLYVLRIPAVDTSLLRLSSTGFDFLFIPLWRKDTSPPRAEG
jgi:hypothetical protein